MTKRLTLDQARCITLGAQGFADPRPEGQVDIRHLRRVLDRIGLLQIDSVNVTVRSHYMPLFSRLGPYRTGLLDEMAFERRELFEYWGHVASLLPIERYPLFRFRMDEFQPWRSVRDIAADHPAYVDGLIDEIRRRGPLTVGELEDPGKRKGLWWGYGPGKTALEWHFAKGNLTVSNRRNFARVYELPERFFSKELLEAEGPSREEAYKELFVLGARHHGVGTVRDLADYYRLNLPLLRPLVDGLVAAGKLIEVEVEGWTEKAYMHPEAKTPRQILGAALLTPFDPVVWERERTERLFDFHYRIEIYVPQPKRIYGYYVYPLLLDGELVGRVDVKADRKGGQLLARGAFVEEGRDKARVANAMAGELQSMAGWLGLDGVTAERKGNLMTDLRKQL